MAAKPRSSPGPSPKVKLPAEEGATDAFPPDEDVSIPPPGSDQTLGSMDPDAGRKGRPRKAD
jgi:hypothetical protein